MQLRTVIAIDGGAQGGIAWKHPNRPANCCAMPKTDFEIVRELKDIIQQSLASPQGPPLFLLEQLVKHMGPGTPASTMAVYASNWGTIKGAAIMAGCRVELITPQKWQKALGLGISGRVQGNYAKAPEGCDKFTKERFEAANAAERKRVASLNRVVKQTWKNKLKDTAQRLYPDLADRITLSTADAVLILEFGLKGMGVKP